MPIEFVYFVQSNKKNTVRQSPTVLKLYSKTTSIIKIMIAYGKGIDAVFGDPG